MGRKPQQQPSMEETLIKIAGLAHSMVFFAAPLENDSRKKGLVEAILRCFSTNWDLLDLLECSEWMPGLDNIHQWETTSLILRESGAVVALEAIATG